MPDGLVFSGFLQPPSVPPDPTGDSWRGLPGPAGPTGAPGATGAAGTVTYGTTAGTATQGNDSRVTGAQTAANVVAAIAAGNPGAFSTLHATGLISPTSAVGVAGTVTNDNAQTGSIGEYISSTVATSAVPLTTTVVSNITSVSLTAGDWDVSGVVAFLPAGSTVPTAFHAAVGTTTAALPALGDPGRASVLANFITGGACSLCCGPVRMSLAGTTTVFLVANSTFVTSTMTAGGTIRARRAR